MTAPSQAPRHHPAPPPTRFDPLALQRRAQQQSAQSVAPRGFHPPPPTRFAPAPAQAKPASFPAAATTRVAPPPTRFGVAPPAQAKPRSARLNDAAVAAAPPKAAAAPLRGPVASRAVQMMEDGDKYTKQNRIAASALGVASYTIDPTTGMKSVRLADLLTSDVHEKLSGYSEKLPKDLLFNTAAVPYQVRSINWQLKNMMDDHLKTLGLTAMTFGAALNKDVIVAPVASDIYRLFKEEGLQLREPHVNRYVDTHHQLQVGALDEDGDMAILMPGVTDPLRWCWYWYADNTDSVGWRKMTGFQRPHVPQFAEIGMGGFVPRAIYDWYNNDYYLTPHYNPVEEKGLKNPYVYLEGAEDWKINKIKNLHKSATQ